MADGDPRVPAEVPAEGLDRPQDRFVASLRPDPAQPPPGTATLRGFLGDSDRPGYRRLYLTRRLDHYAELGVADVVEVAAISPEEQPFVGDEATAVTLRGEATITFTRTRPAVDLDEFDLDIRRGGPTAAYELLACASTVGLNALREADALA